MIWQSWNDFWSMGGYAPYVWGSYAVTLALIAAEVAMLGRRKRNILDQLDAAAQPRGTENDETAA